MQRDQGPSDHANWGVASSRTAALALTGKLGAALLPSGLPLMLRLPTPLASSLALWCRKGVGDREGQGEAGVLEGGVRRPWLAREGRWRSLLAQTQLDTSNKSLPCPLEARQT